MANVSPNRLHGRVSQFIADSTLWVDIIEKTMRGGGDITYPERGQGLPSCVRESEHLDALAAESRSAGEYSQHSGGDERSDIHALSELDIFSEALRNHLALVRHLHLRSKRQRL